MIREILALFFRDEPLKTIIAPPRPRPLPANDGRRFAWVAAKAYAKKDGQPEMVPVILYDPLLCAEKRLEIVMVRSLDAADYGLSLDELAAKYPLSVTVLPTMT